MMYDFILHIMHESSIADLFDIIYNNQPCCIIMIII